jgi:hypothetical protein
VPKSAGSRVRAAALGDGFGFAPGSADWLANCAAVAYVSVAAAEYRHPAAAAPHQPLVASTSNRRDRRAAPGARSVRIWEAMS